MVDLEKQINLNYKKSQFWMFYVIFFYLPKNYQLKNDMNYNIYISDM